MQVYIEYAFAENFLLDFMLLFFAFRFTRESVRALPIVSASSFGAAFACVFALIAVPYAVSLCIKIAAGIFMCFLARLHFLQGGFFRLSKSERRAKICAFLRYSCVFFVLSACLAGAFLRSTTRARRLKPADSRVRVFYVCMRCGREKAFQNAENGAVRAADRGVRKR